MNRSSESFGEASTFVLTLRGTKLRWLSRISSPVLSSVPALQHSPQCPGAGSLETTVPSTPLQQGSIYILPMEVNPRDVVAKERRLCSLTAAGADDKCRVLLGSSKKLPGSPPSKCWRLLKHQVVVSCLPCTSRALDTRKVSLTFDPSFFPQCTSQ